MCRDFSCFAVTFAAVGGGVNTRLQSGANVLFVSSLWAAVAETFVELAAVFFLYLICRKSPHPLRKHLAAEKKSNFGRFARYLSSRNVVRPGEI